MTALAIDPEGEDARIILSRPGRNSWLRTDSPRSSIVLRVPLLGKLLGANLVLVVGAIAGPILFPSASMAMQLGTLLGVSFGVTALLAWLALRPIAQLEATAERVSAGDFSARVPGSLLADRNIASLASTMNRLLDRVTGDRARIQYLAGRSVRARDIEREAVARELRDSLAQTLAGLAMQLSATKLMNTDPRVGEQVEQAQDLVRQLTDDVKSVAETLYPGTLEELGLVNAVEALARRISRRSDLHVQVDAGAFRIPMSNTAASALYRVAEEALRNIEQHARATHARVLLRSNGEVTLEIEDDGRGVDMRSRDPLQAGLGLFSAKAVLALAGGELQISSAPGLGTRVVARVPAGMPTEQK